MNAPSPSAPLFAEAGGQSLSLRRMLGPSLIINAIAPAAGYALLTSRGVSNFNALVLVALFPLLGIGVGLARTGALDAIGAVSLAFITVGLVTSLVSGDSRFLLLKESLITGLFGLVCLASLLLPRPLMFYFGRSFSSGGNREAARRFDALWQHERFRHMMRVMTIVWGCGYLAEALVRVLLLQVLAITAFLAVSQFLALGVTLLLMLWTIRYARAARSRAQAAGVEVPGTTA